MVEIIRSIQDAISVTVVVGRIETCILNLDSVTQAIVIEVSIRDKDL